jgi:hypothetical protein
MEKNNPNPVKLTLGHTDTPFGILISKTAETETHYKVLSMKRQEETHFSPIINILSNLHIDHKPTISLIEKHQAFTSRRPIHYEIYSLFNSDEKEVFVRRYTSLTGKYNDINSSNRMAGNLIMLGKSMVTIHTGFHPQHHEEGIKRLLICISREIAETIERSNFVIDNPLKTTARPANPP